MNRGRGFTPVAASAWKKLYPERFAGGGMVGDPWGTVIARAWETPGVPLGVPTSVADRKSE